MQSKISLLWFLFSLPSAASYSVSASHFAPVPMSSTESFRTFADLNLAPSRSVELETGILYHIWPEFDFGLGIHGGVVNEITTGGTLGVDVILRFIKNIRPNFFLGVTTQAGLLYSGLGDPTTEPEQATAIPVYLALVMGRTLKNNTKLYFSPGIELGQTMKGGDVVWKSALGLRLTFGAVIPLSERWALMIETRPTMSNIDSASPIKIFQLDSGLGVLFDF